MKKEVKSLSLIILSIVLIFSLTTVVSATGLIDVTSNSTGSTNTAATNKAPTQNITEIQAPKFSSVTQTVYALKNTNIKESYSTTSKNIGTLLKDESIKRTGMSTTGWSRVETSDGKVAYVQTTDLTTTPPASATNTTLQPTNKTSTYNNNTNTLPQTGIGDNTGMYVIIGICVVSAIYAYKKIRDYNV